MIYVSSLPLPLLLLLLSAHIALVRTSPPTYEDRDPITGKPIQCERCPPGTFRRARCSSTKNTECSPCPEGSFTQLWNHINKCLRCGVCNRNEVVKRECTAHNDCECECKQGYFYNPGYGMCDRHGVCPSGQGVLTEGTAEKDTVCHICSNNTYSDTFSAHQKCMTHKNCSDAGLQMVLKGSTWHDSLCANCTDVKDAAEYLKEIIPAFFVHHPMNIQRLRRIVYKLPSEDGKKQERNSGKELDLSDLHAQINTWAASATGSQIRQLLTVLTPTKASGIADRLQNKLKHIDRNLAEQCCLEVINMVN
ncbi:tumor necrosis factor receptor superfamily member 6B-like [Melanotaenia boesemani]|uniref:tumor necrosis factor receptor superfamily member 6B-like n=1 Tax=Melanotaenia boesemani TaxID=1250792 RepID=UPI001C04D1A6|nr:tumor necrosis factor receptor superfamily member 6B-like [Melanotaenia boesemani]